MARRVKRKEKCQIVKIHLRGKETCSWQENIMLDFYTTIQMNKIWESKILLILNWIYELFFSDLVHWYIFKIPCFEGKEMTSIAIPIPCICNPKQDMREIEIQVNFYKIPLDMT